MFVPFDRSVRVSLGVVTLGVPARLRGCLDALVAHESRHDFTVAVVVNADAPVGSTVPEVPTGVRVLSPAGNLGWSGGLHLARSATDAELVVWVQDDMVPEPGWLDALVAAADAHPEAGVFGSVRVDEHGTPIRHNAGDARPADRVAEWSSTDRTEEELPDEVTAYDWVTSKGLLTRTSVFDELGGPDPRLFPLYHVDKDYCTHARCHGYDVVLVPGARLWHAQSQSSAPELRAFVAAWRDPVFDARWAQPLRRLEGTSAGRVDHPCRDWQAAARDEADPQVTAAVGLEASRMLVPYMRERERAAAALHAQAAEVHGAAQRAVADATEAHAAAVAEARRLEERLRRAENELERLRSSRSWRVTGPLRSVVRRLRG